jgi:hypothetical protein
LCTSVIPALGRLKQEDSEFKASLGYILRPCFKKKKKGVGEIREYSPNIEKEINTKFTQSLPENRRREYF